MDEFDESPPPSRPKPSKIPSWIMLGFVLGALFVWALPRRGESVAPTLNVPVRTVTLSAPDRLVLTDVEAVFESWDKYAVWADNTTYVCWYSIRGDAPDCFEVLRRGEGVYFFRSVPRPKNLRVVGNVPKNSPLQFLNPAPE